MPWRARETLGARLPRLQRFAAGLEWVRRESPEQHEALRRKVSRYQALHDLVRGGGGEVPPKYGLVPVLRYIVSRGGLLTLALPFALVGLVIWSPVAMVARIVVSSATPDYERMATFKLLGALLGVSALWAGWILIGYWRGGTWLALVVAFLAPVLGLVGLRWLEVAQEFREDALLFVRLQGRPDVRRRFAQQRRELVEAFQRVEDQLPSFQDHDNVGAARPRPAGPGEV